MSISEFMGTVARSSRTSDVFNAVAEGAPSRDPGHADRRLEGGRGDHERPLDVPASGQKTFGCSVSCDSSGAVRRAPGWWSPRRHGFTVFGRSGPTTNRGTRRSAGGPTVIDHGLIDRLLDLHSRRLGLADLHDPVRRPENLITTLAVGGSEYCRHESFHGYDERTRSLIGRIESFGCSLKGEDFIGHDVVHWDLHPGNLRRSRIGSRVHPWSKSASAEAQMTRRRLTLKSAHRAPTQSVYRVTIRGLGHVVSQSSGVPVVRLHG